MSNSKQKLRGLLLGLMCLSFVLPQPDMIYGAQENTAAAQPTPTPDPHTQAYYQAPESNSYEGWPAGPNVEAGSAVVMDLYSGAILYSKNADAQQYPARITKIMTTLLACENLDMNAQMTVSECRGFSNEPGSSSIYADMDEVFYVKQALMAVMLESANEVSVAIAEETCGSSKKFVEKMNERARQLGCTNTHFNNPNGLPDETHYTTANDMAKIARAAWYNPYFRTFTTKDLYEIPTKTAAGNPLSSEPPQNDGRPREGLRGCAWRKDRLHYRRRKHPCHLCQEKRHGCCCGSS